MEDLSVTVTADTEEFVESIEDATEALNKFQEALDGLEETPVSIEIEKRGDCSYTRVETERDAKRGLAEALEANNVR